MSPAVTSTTAVLIATVQAIGRPHAQSVLQRMLKTVFEYRLETARCIGGKSVLHRAMIAGTEIM